MTDTISEYEAIDHRTVDRALSLLGLFRAIDPGMPIGAAKALLTVASGEVMSVTDLSRLTGCAPSSASRYVHYLSDRDRQGNGGHDLIETYPDPKDSRRKALRLTPRGELLMQLLAGVLRSRR